jgi:hypothetical protein
MFRIFRVVPHMIRKKVDETRGVKRKEFSDSVRVNSLDK